MFQVRIRFRMFQVMIVFRMFQVGPVSRMCQVRLLLSHVSSQDLSSHVSSKYYHSHVYIREIVYMFQVNILFCMFQIIICFHAPRGNLTLVSSFARFACILHTDLKLSQFFVFFEMTSFAFILLWVPLPVCQTTRGKWSSSLPSMTSSAAFTISSALSLDNLPNSEFTIAADFLTIPNALIILRGNL